VIDTGREIPLSFAQAAKLPYLPIRRAGKRPHPATLWRWALHGVRGVKLESVMCGAVRCTSAEAIGRFFERLTAQAAGSPAPTPTPRVDRRAVERAERVLDAAGI
jgi:hypothetical protein